MFFFLLLVDGEHFAVVHTLRILETYFLNHYLAFDTHFVVFAFDFVLMR